MFDVVLRGASVIDGSGSPAVRADVTVTFGALKPGLLIDPGQALSVGEALRSFTVDAAYVHEKVSPLAQKGDLSRFIL